MEDEAHKATTEVAPQVAQMLEGGFTKAFETLAASIKAQSEAMQQQAEMNRKLIEVLSKPKVVTLGNINRNDDGFLVGASATVN